MENPFYLILYLSVLILIAKYIYDLKSERMLIIVLSLFGMTCLGYLLTRTFQTPIFINIGIVSGLIISPILFSIHLLNKKGTNKEKLVWRMMLIPTLTLLIIYQFKLLHLPQYGFLYYMVIVAVLIGGWIVIKKPGMKEIFPFQIVLIFLIIDTIIVLMK